MTDDKKREILAQVGRVNSDICYGCPIIERYLELMSAQPEIVRCKDCKHFEIKDHWADFNGVPILATSDCQTCNKWADGCKTKPDGYCFMAERRD